MTAVIKLKRARNAQRGKRGSETGRGGYELPPETVSAAGAAAEEISDLIGELRKAAA